ncbi:hypothetical protein FB451DRAFT_1255036 [Mycena latifolia]|nr:hypothetical protein FB451DRAFT_1255036 [Mycena latifolia]
MHRCLTILEIVEMICSNLEPTSSPAHKALAVLARTSPVFSGPALDVLWKTQTSLVPLLRCMPPDLFEISPSTDHWNRAWRLARPILATDWERSRIYASRVKSFVFSYWSLRGMKDIMPVLGLSVPGGSLFPNLTKLRWTPSVSVEFTQIHIFITPRLTSISFSCSFSHTNLSLLSTLATTCPRLSRISVPFHPNLTQADRATSPFICALPCIKSLTMGRPDMLALEHLGRLPTLTSLTLLSVSSLSAPSLKPYPTFNHLRDLSVTADAIHLATTFLAMCSGPPLTSLYVSFAACASGAQTEALYNTVKKCCSHTSLTTLTLENDLTDSPADGQAGLVITGNFLHILSCFTNLTSLSITSAIGFDLDDATIASLAPAWPQMQQFKLNTSVSSTRPQGRLTLQCLSSLAELWPRLETLQLHFDARRIPESQSGRAPPMQRSLTSLDVTCSKLSTSAPVARFVSGIFPNLVSITTYREEDDNEDPDEVAVNGEDIATHKLWKEVEAQIPEFVAAREEAKTWAQE